MNAKGIALVLVLALLAGAGWYATQTAQPEPLPEEAAGKLPPAEEGTSSYDYACTDNVTMTMEPVEGMQSLRVMVRGGAFPAEGVLAAVPSEEGARFESQAMAFVGVGEEVNLFSPTQTVTCRPVPVAESAPFNWGDPESAGGEEPRAN